MFLENCPNKGHDYWIVARASRAGSRVRNTTALYLGRLDNLTSSRRTDLERKVMALRDDKILHTFYAKLAEYGQPVPRPSFPGLLEEGPFSLPPVDFATLCHLLAQDDLTARDLAAHISHMGLPVRVDALAAAGVQVDLVKKTRSIFLYYPRT